VLERARTVVAPDGKEWKVGIRWLPRKPRWKGWGFKRSKRRASEWLEITDLPIPDSLSALLIVIGIVIVLVLAWFFVFPVLFLLLDVLIVLVLAGAAVATRVLFRRPWIVQAVSDDETKEWPVVGWRASRDFAAAVAVRLERGLRVDDPPVSSRGTSPGSASPPGAQ
jgi:hypothetical protein